MFKATLTPERFSLPPKPGKSALGEFTNFDCLWSNFWKYNSTRHIEKHSEHNRKVIKKA